MGKMDKDWGTMRSTYNLLNFDNLSETRRKEGKNTARELIVSGNSAISSSSLVTSAVGMAMF